MHLGEGRSHELHALRVGIFQCHIAVHRALGQPPDERRRDGAAMFGEPVDAFHSAQRGVDVNAVGWRRARNPATYPAAMTAHFEFAARGKQPPVKMNWYDGGLYAPRPDVLPDDVVLKSEGGVFIIGEKGILLHETYGQNPQLYPRHLMQKTAAVAPTYQRITVSHEMNWAQACKGDGRATCPFEYAAQLTETMLLGIVALRAGQGRKILYDAANMTITNAPDANQYLKPGYKPGWEV